MPLATPIRIGFGLISIALAAQGQALPYRAAAVGTVSVSEGVVSVNGRPLLALKEDTPPLRASDRLETRDGHAEVLLTPGVFVRLGRNAGLEMKEAGTSGIRLRLLSGSAMVEVNEVSPEMQIGINAAPGIARLYKAGLYRLDSAPPVVMVLKGEAVVAQGEKYVRVTKGHQSGLADNPAIAKIQGEDKDDLALWSRARSEYEAKSSVMMAQYAVDSGWRVGSSWMWNPWWGSYTWVAGGSVLNPYGFTFWSPASVFGAYPSRYYGIRAASPAAIQSHQPFEAPRGVRRR